MDVNWDQGKYKWFRNPRAWVCSVLSSLRVLLRVFNCLVTTGQARCLTDLEFKHIARYVCILETNSKVINNVNKVHWSVFSKAFQILLWQAWLYVCYQTNTSETQSCDPAHLIQLKNRPNWILSLLIYYMEDVLSKYSYNYWKCNYAISSFHDQWLMITETYICICACSFNISLFL